MPIPHLVAESVVEEPWWDIHGEALLRMLRRVANGEEPDLVYAEAYANAQRIPPRTR